MKTMKLIQKIESSKPNKVKKPRSPLELAFANQVLDNQLSAPFEEFQFDASRKWRFDFAWVEKMLAVEIEGGTHTKGRHTRHVGFSDDCRKYNAATVLGWRVLRFTGDMVSSGEAVDLCRLALSKEA